MYLANLDAATRRHMVDEINRDIAAGALYVSPRLSEVGRQAYPALLLDAAERGDAESLAAELRVRARLNITEISTRNGKTYSKRVPVNAAETMAEGEFNRFYARGVCVRAMEENVGEVIVYRAKQVASPRLQSEAMIGVAVRAAQLLEDLRVNVGVEPALGIPPGPNSGLSVCLPT
jgi:hypothetical protein